MPDRARQSRRSTGRGSATKGTAILVVVLAVAGGGLYELARAHDRSTGAVSSYCRSLTLAFQLAYDHKGGMASFHKMVDKDAEAIGGRVLADTKSLELAIAKNNTSTAEKYLTDLGTLCLANGSPISSPVTTT